MKTVDAVGGVRDASFQAEEGAASSELIRSEASVQSQDGNVEQTTAVMIFAPLQISRVGRCQTVSV